MNWQGLFFDTLDSTQNHLKAHWQTLPHASYVVSTQQTEGKGRENRSWESSPGGLYFSVLLKPTRVLPLLSWKAWFTTLETLEFFTSQPLQLKAPNDILHQGQKLSGLLIDGAIQGHLPQYYIIGVGINISQAKFSESLSACRLKDLTENEVTHQELLTHWLTVFEQHLDRSDAHWGQEMLARFGQRTVQFNYTNPHFIQLKEYWHEHNPRHPRNLCSPTV